jgi:hypothetical protein
MFSKNKIQLIFHFVSQITTSTFFKVDTFSNKWWAFTQMQLGHKLKNVTGLTFLYKLGSGAKKWF